jgi:hypothetical protein
VPAIQVKGPFSVRKPESDEQPGPPFNQIVICSGVCSAVEGKNQKKSFRVSSGLSEIGSRPA